MSATLYSSSSFSTSILHSLRFSIRVSLILCSSDRSSRTDIPLSSSFIPPTIPVLVKSTAVVVPSPASLFERSAANLIASIILSSKGSSEDTCLAIVTPSLVVVTIPVSSSNITLPPCGDNVCTTGSAIKLTALIICGLASS